MKKFLFLGIAATAMFASCTNDEMVEMNPQSAIGFETFVDKSTRATDVTLDNLGTFWVYGWRTKDGGLPEQIFDNQEVSVNALGECTYSPLQYWVGDYEYDFEAVSPQTGGSGVTVTASCGASTIKFVSDSQTDLIYASASKDLLSYDHDILASDPGAVGLIFGHLLSRVKFTFTNGAVAGSAAKIDVTDVTIESAGTTGVYTPSTGTWATATATGDVSFADITNIGGNASGETDHKYLIPYNVMGHSVSFTVTMTQGSVSDSFDYTVTLPDLTLEKGKSYNFKATFNPGYPIEFTADVTDWGVFNEVTIP